MNYEYKFLRDCFFNVDIYIFIYRYNRYKIYNYDEKKKKNFKGVVLCWC